ncbi:MAG: hypothetical protein NPIRA02_22980 [Nitrospirales bacterium]|nr:MAG: hypothetical protein NPIRA02_22980 [Nitrospirales bacterium]
MIKNRTRLEQFEREQIMKTKPDLFSNLKIVEALLQEARNLGVFSPKDPLEGIDVDIRVANAFNVRTPVDEDF